MSLPVTVIVRGWYSGSPWDDSSFQGEEVLKQKQRTVPSWQHMELNIVHECILCVTIPKCAVRLVILCVVLVLSPLPTYLVVFPLTNILCLSGCAPFSGLTQGRPLLPCTLLCC